MIARVKVCPVCQREYPAGVTSCPEDGVPLVAVITDVSSRAEELVGKIVEGRYRIERIIGKGGMGTVYACRHVVVGKIAAMKVLRAGVERSDGVLQRFVREAQTANLLKSRHIVEVSDFGQLPSGAFFVVMELLEGQDLAHGMRNGLSRAQLVHVFVQVAETLQLAHDKGIVHRDLKPDNVFLVHDSGDPLFVKLLDFGIAKILHGDGGGGLTETGVILGTPYYMSPEQARAEAIDHRSDIYALGVMMYRAFTGRLPFVADSTMGVLTRHITEAPQPPSEIGNVDQVTERMILRCLAKKPEYRYQSMREVAEALRMVPLAPVPPHREQRTVADGPAPGAAWPATPTPAYATPPPAVSAPHAAMPSGPYPSVVATPSHFNAPSGVYDPRISSGPSAAHSAVVGMVAGPAATGTLTALQTQGGSPAPIAEGTTRGVAATSPPATARGSSVALVLAGGLGMAALGGALAAFFLLQPRTVSSTSPPPIVAAGAPSASATATATATASAAPIAVTTATPSAMPATPAPAAPSPRGRGARVVSAPAPAPGPAPLAPAPAAKTPRDIRSPFE